MYKKFVDIFRSKVRKKNSSKYIDSKVVTKRNDSKNFYLSYKN